MSAKFAKASFTSPRKVLVSGITRNNGHGIPCCVLQQPCEKKADVTTMRGLVKAAVLEGDNDCPELVSMSLYDNEPVHFISMACDSVKWVERKRSVWNQVERKMVDVKFL